MIGQCVVMTSEASCDGGRIGGTIVFVAVTAVEDCDGQHFTMVKKCDAQRGVTNGSAMDNAIVLVEGPSAWCSERRPAQLMRSSG